MCVCLRIECVLEMYMYMCAKLILHSIYIIYGIYVLLYVLQVSDNSCACMLWLLHVHSVYGALVRVWSTDLRG